MSGSANRLCIEKYVSERELQRARTRTMTARLLAGLGLALISGSAAAVDAGVLFNNVSLPCWIENQKVIAVLNATGKPLPAGTVLHVNATPVPDGDHFIRSKQIGLTPSGAVIRIGAVQSSSCTASARLPRPVLRVQ